jgi:hypothetical protein
VADGRCRSPSCCAAASLPSSLPIAARARATTVSCSPSTTPRRAAACRTARVAPSSVPGWCSPIATSTDSAAALPCVHQAAEMRPAGGETAGCADPAGGRDEDDGQIEAAQIIGDVSRDRRDHAAIPSRSSNTASSTSSAQCRTRTASNSGSTPRSCAAAASAR